MSLHTRIVPAGMIFLLALGCGRAPSDQRLSRKEPAGSAARRLTSDDTLGTPDCRSPDAPASPAASMTPASAAALAPDSLDDGRTVDVLVVYTAMARQHFERMGRSIDSAIARGAAQADTAFANSGIDLRVHVVRIAQVDYVEDTLSGASDLDSLQGRKGAAIRALRDSVMADQVTFIR
jgi:hypothetical protein